VADCDRPNADERRRAPPSRTIAATRARKLPDLRSRPLLPGFALVSIAHRSDTTANPNRETSSGRSQLAVPATAIATPVAPASIAAMTALAWRPGAGIVKAAPTTRLSVRYARG
jgi:hypothetical protein